MNLQDGIKWLTPTVSTSTAQISSKATGTVSAQYNCTGFGRVRVWMQQNKAGVGAKACKLVFKVGTHTASALFSSAVHTLVHAGTSAAALSASRCIGYDIALEGVGPYITCLASTATTSGVTGIVAYAYNGNSIPTGTSTTGISGFTSLIRVPAQP